LNNIVETTLEKPLDSPPDDTCMHLNFDRTLSEISTKFINLPVYKVDSQIQEAQQQICECLDVDLSSLWQWTGANNTCLSLTHLHRPADGPDIPDEINAHNEFPWVVDKMLHGETLILNTEEMPPEAAKDQEMRRSLDVASSVVIPLMVDQGTLIGVIAFDGLYKERRWSEKVITRLSIVAQIFTNAIVRKKVMKRLELRMQFESLITEISADFINLPVDQIDPQIEYTQKRICDCLDLELSFLWQWSDDSPHYMTITHLCSPPDGPERPEHIDASKAFPHAFKKLMNGELIAQSTENLPPEAQKDQESLRSYGIKSSVAFPLSVGNDSIIGFLSFDTLKKERSWEEPTLEKLSLIAQIFANTLARKRADLKLHESETRLSLTTNSAGVGLWFMDTDKNYVWATPKTRELFNFKEHEVLNYDRFDQMIDPADRKKVNQAVQSAIQTGNKLSVEFRVAHPDKTVRWFFSQGRLITGITKKARLMGATIDISERKQMEKQLSTQLEEIRSLKKQLEKENAQLRKEIDIQYVHDDIISRNPVMKSILTQAEQVARTESSVLIEGETGTGKELLARAIHRLSNRSDLNLVTVNCASLPPTLVESELFGREKGAYTGALTRMTGRFELADHATLFLDEIGELQLDVQAKLLRVLEQGSFERLGSTRQIQVDVRIIAATNKNLSKQVELGKFRKDLYYRLNVFPIHLPPLRKRTEDIAPLVWSFVKEYENKMGRRIDRIPRSCIDELQSYTWPGNIRELRNLVERSMIICNGRTLDLHMHQSKKTDKPENKTLEETERDYLIHVLQNCQWRISGPGGAAETAGLKRTTLQSRMKKLGIKRPESTE